MEALAERPRTNDLLRADPPLVLPVGSPGLSRAAWTENVEPIFLVGCPRSGTTWLQAMLAAHPAVYSGPETHFFRLYAPLAAEYERSRAKHFGFSRYLSEASFRDFLAASFWALISGLPEPEGQPRYFLEKTPDHGRHASLILDLFPRARFIHLIRDARAVAASLIRISGSWASDWAASTSTDAALWWVENVQACRSIREQVARPEQYYELRYEDLRSEPETRLDELFRWLGLSAGASTVRSIVYSHSLEGLRESGGRCVSIAAAAELPEGFVGDAAASGETACLYPAQRELVEELAGPLLRELGYSVEEGHAAPAPAPAPAPEEEPVEREASVLIVGDGNDPTLILETLSRMAPDWQEGWELVLVSRSGAAADQAAAYLEGTFRVVRLPEPGTYCEALNQGAAAAAGRDLLFPTARGLFRVDRQRFAEMGGARGFNEAEAVAWLAWRVGTGGEGS